MITIVASSITGLFYVFTSGLFNTIATGYSFQCFYTVNAMLSGAVSISASSNSSDINQALMIALFAVIWYGLGSKLLIKLEIDDPQEAFLIFGIQGLWGLLAVGLFDR